MEDEAVAWAESELGDRVLDAVPMPGGLTSTMLALRCAGGRQAVLRLMTNEPWRTYGSDLTRRERDAQLELATTGVPAPTTLALDADGSACGVAAHLMSRAPGAPLSEIDGAALDAMADLLVQIHAVRPAAPFRTYQSWAWPEKWVVPPWTIRPESWRAAFAVLAEDPPPYAPTFLHRDYSHRNLLWSDGAVSGVVDWVEASTGPAWLDAGHAATNLAVAFDPAAGRGFVRAYAEAAGTAPERYWMIMDAVGFLPPPGKAPMFESAAEFSRLDDWLHELLAT